MVVFHCYVSLPECKLDEILPISQQEVREIAEGFLIWGSPAAYVFATVFPW